MREQPGSRTIRRAAQALATRVPGRRRLLARVSWGILVALTLVIGFASLPEYLAQLQTPCAGAVCLFTPRQAAVLTGIGWSPEVYATVLAALTLASIVLSLVVSTVIIWRRPDDRMALLVALMLVAFGPIIEADSLRSRPSPWQVPNAALDFLALALGMLVFSLFPSGQFVPRWTRWLLVVVLAALILDWFFPTTLLPGLPIWYLVLGQAAIMLVAQLYRYRRVSTPLQRQQTKWVVLGAALNAVFWMGGAILVLFFPALADRDSPAGVPYHLVLNSVGISLVLLIPLSIGIAMLRYRLWDIDTLINKALVYSLLTSLLAALYVSLILGLEHLAGLVTRQEDQPVVIVVSTLVIAALFLPLRRRLQALIDRRFYRKKYDAEQTLAAFSATLRNQVDLEQIREQLLAVVQETMQPASLSLWICPVKPQAAEGGARAATRTLAEERAGAEHPDAG